MITLKNVTKIMDNNVILDNINLNLEEGKIYGLVGRNGSGKSILLKVICGFLKPTEGIVLVDNKDLAKEPVFPESIAALIERPNYIPDLNAFDNLFMIASIKNIIGQKEIEDTLKLVNLANDNKSFKKYSLGMKQKLGIAQVLMEKPKIMILDDTTSAVDNETEYKIRQSIKSQSRGHTSFIISHRVSSFENCDVILVLQNGELVQMGSHEELMAQSGYYKTVWNEQNEI